MLAPTWISCSAGPLIIAAAGPFSFKTTPPTHKDAEVWTWFKCNRHWLEVYQLPPYSPELNPTERLWQYTRKNGTHDRYFASQDERVATLTRVFEDMQSYPELIRPRLLPFC